MKSKTKKDVMATVGNWMEDNGGKDISLLYTKNFINWTGNVKGSSLPYSEVIAEYLLEKDIIGEILNIPEIKRGNPYPMRRTPNNTSTNRDEERLAKSLYNYCWMGHNKQGLKDGIEIDGIGTVFNYQVPLKGKRGDEGVGKIDLVSYTKKFNKEIDKLFLLELKGAKSKETLLRSILEIATYFQQLDKEKFLKECKEKGGLPAKVKIIKGVLIFEGSEPHKQLMELKDTPNLQELIKKLEVKVFTLTKPKATQVWPK